MKEQYSSIFSLCFLLLFLLFFLGCVSLFPRLFVSAFEPPEPYTQVASVGESVDLGSYVGSQIDSRLSQADSSTGLSIYKYRTAILAPRNPDSWTQKGMPINFTGVSGWGDGGNTEIGDHFRGGVTLISPRHYITASHISGYWASIGRRVTFYDVNGNPVTRTIVNSVSFGADINVGVLDSDLPSNIAYYPLISSSNLLNILHKVYAFSSLLYKVPIVIFNQDAQAFVVSLDIPSSTNIGHNLYTSGIRSSFSKELRNGDSGLPGFLVIDDKPILLFVSHSESNGPNLGNYISEINSAMNTLGNPNGYRITEYNPSRFTQYTVTPPAPTVFTATPVYTTGPSGCVKDLSESTIKLEWNRPAGYSSDINHYNITIMGSLGISSLITINNSSSPISVPPAQLTYSHSPPNLGTNYTYILQVTYNDTTDSLPINIQAYMPNLCPPTVITAITSSSQVEYGLATTYGQSSVVIPSPVPSPSPVPLLASNITPATVSNVVPNTTPVLLSIGPKSVAEGSLLTFTIQATDANSDTLIYTVSSLPTGATFNASNRVFSFTPTYTQSGNYEVTFMVNDGKGGTDSKTLVINITNTNRAPSAYAGTNQSVTLPATVSLSALGSYDHDGTALAYAWSKISGPGTVSISNNTAVSTTATFSTQGNYVLQVLVSDGALTSTDQVTIAVNQTLPPDSDNDGIFDSADNCPNTPAILSSQVNNFGCPKPKASKFIVTPSVNTADITSLSSFEISNTYGKVAYLPTNSTYSLVKDNGTHKTQLDLDAGVTIANRMISINSSSLPELNKPATITFYNVNIINPIILKDGVFCTQCTVVSYNGGTFVFRVPGFSTYMLVADTLIPTPTQPLNLQVTTVSPTQIANQNLNLTNQEQGILFLQKALNALGYPVAESGPGSRGYETTDFNTATKEALTKYQSDRIDIGLQPTGIIDNATLFLIKSDMSKLSSESVQDTKINTTASSSMNGLQLVGNFINVFIGKVFDAIIMAVNNFLRFLKI